MRSITPPESVHALDPDELRGPEVTFWVVCDGDQVVGCGALKELDQHTGEVKSMRTAAVHRGRGVASMMLGHLMATARQRGYRALYLETGSSSAFVAARALYAKHGFVPCGPFAYYGDDPNNAFMMREL